MADEGAENSPVLEAEHVTVIEGNPALEAALENAEARAEQAEQVADAVTQAAVHSEIVAATEERIEACQTEIQHSQSVAVDALAGMQALRSETDQRLSSMEQTLNSISETLAAVLTRPDLSQSPIAEAAEADPAQALVVDGLPVVESPEESPRKSRWI